MTIRSWFILVLVVMFISSLIVFIPGSAEAIGEPQVILEFDEGEEVQTAEVAPGKKSVVVFPGTVTVYLAAGSQVQDVEIQLIGTIEQGWPVTINPETLSMEHGDNESFTATVIVPADACCDIPSILEVSATAKTFPGALIYRTAPINGTINITQYYGVSLESNESLMDANTGDHCRYHLKVNNDGNGRDVFEVNIVNRNDLERTGLIISLGQDQVEIDGMSSETVVLSISIPENKNCIGTHSLKMGVHSRNDNSVSSSYIFTLIISLAPEPADMDPVEPDPPGTSGLPDTPDDPETPGIPGDQSDSQDTSPSGSTDDAVLDESPMEPVVVVAIIAAIIVAIMITVLYLRTISDEK
jgi:hypothetical protein